VLISIRIFQNRFAIEIWDLRKTLQPQCWELIFLIPYEDFMENFIELYILQVNWTQTLFTGPL